MIGRLRGILQEKNPPQILLDVSGVGYEVDVTMTTFYQLPSLNEMVTLYIHQIFREDAHLLYGFINDDERQTFRTLIKVNGIGAKIALAILSSINANELSSAIEQNDITRLVRIPGIGKKTAERLALELRDKLGKNVVEALNDASCRTEKHGAINDIENALLSLGYNEKEAKLACKNIAPDIDVGEGIRLALKAISGN